MKKTLMIILCGIFLFGVTGCGAKEESVSVNSDLVTSEEVATMIDKKMASLVEENNNLKTTIEKLETKISKLESNNTSNYNDLKKLIDKKASKTDLDTKYNELKNTIKKINIVDSSTTEEDYTITKEELIGVWTAIGSTSDSYKIEFTKDNVEVIGNWIVYKNNGYLYSLYYMYKDGKLHFADERVYTKQ